MGASEFAGKTVLVTGASRGIGLATAEHFAALGADVGLVARGIDGLRKAQAKLSSGAHAVAADLTDPAECARAVAEVEAELGPIDVLISCAGVLRRDFVEDVTPADFEQSYRLHAGAGLWLTQAVLAGMRARGYGRIVLVSSEFGLIGGPSYAVVLHREVRPRRSRRGPPPRAGRQSRPRLRRLPGRRRDRPARRGDQVGPDGRDHVRQGDVTRPSRAGDRTRRGRARAGRGHRQTPSEGRLQSCSAVLVVSG